MTMLMMAQRDGWQQPSPPFPLVPLKFPHSHIDAYLCREIHENDAGRDARFWSFKPIRIIYFYVFFILFI